MKFPIPRKRQILAMHRWMGILSAIFLLTLALTGLCLNHAEILGLHDKPVRATFILKRYNMQTSKEIMAFRVGGENTISVVDGALYFNSDYVTETGELLGCSEGESFLVLAVERGLLLLTNEGEVIELLAIDELPFSDFQGLGIDSNGNPVLITGEGNWSADSEWLDFQPFTGEYAPVFLDRHELDRATAAAILQHYQGKGPSLYRVLLDLHSGRLFGWKGKVVADLTAVAIIFLVTSGIIGWLRNSRKPWMLK